MENKDKKLVLVVEDEGDLQEAISFKLKRAGFNVALAGTSKEATNSIEQETPDIIWLDLLLPGSSGIDLLETIRKREQTKDTPVIVVSALTKKEERQKVEGLGINDYIIKSDTPIEEIIKKVETLLNK